MEKQPDHLPTSIRGRKRLFGVLMAVILGIYLRERLVQMDGRFFQPSSSGIEGLVLYEIGDLSGAADAYRAHLREEYRTERTAEDSGWDALLRGEFEEAADLSQKALEKNRDDQQALLTLGEVALQNGDPLGALGLADRVLQKETDQYDALLLSSVAQARLGDYERALFFLKRGLRYSRIERRLTSFLTVMEEAGRLADLSEKSRPHALLAFYYRYLRIFDPSNGRAAIRHAKAAIDAGDRTDEAHVTWGVVFEKEDSEEKALSHFLKAIEANPKNAEAYRRAGNIYSHRGDLLKEYQMRKAAFEAERDPFYFNHFNEFLTKKIGDYHQALALSKDLLEINPTNVWIVHSVAYLYGFLGEPERALDYYGRALLLEPKDPRLYQGIGSALSEVGRKEEAIEAYRTAISLNPEKGWPYFELAILYRDQRDYRTAIQAYENGFRLSQGNINLKANLCILYYQVAEFRQSSDCFRKVLATDPRNKTAQHLLPYVMANVRKGGLK